MQEYGWKEKNIHRINEQQGIVHKQRLKVNTGK